MENLTQFAARVGVNKMIISRHSKPGGRLESFVVRAPNGKATGIRDPEAAAVHWHSTFDPTKAPASVIQARDEFLARQHGDEPEDSEDDAPETSADGRLTLSEAKRNEAIWKALEAERKFRLAAGELVTAAEVASKIAAVFSEVRTKLLAIPSRVKQKLPHLTVDDLTELENQIRDALTELADAGSEDA